MRILILAAALLLVLVPICRAELMVPVAMAESGALYLAYTDNTVWWTAGGPLIEIPSANRGLPIRLMYPGGGGAAFVLYEDNQVWTVGRTTGCQFWVDMTRPDDPAMIPVAFVQGGGFAVVAAYADGQVWVNDGNGIQRSEMWERPAQPTATEGATWGTVKGAFR